ncbi:Uncharacterized protein APZ42_027964 [Daphnia magna]|uniref:Uncharacterized protein n=1 Tax=Daphnia magna TaxID=35525 RepID=A0A164QXW5_9CRUS|nr:Uncharacterized protein APZ42_027964 [Daphnia magna]
MTTLCDPVSIQYYRTCDVRVPPVYSRVSALSLILVNREYNALLHGGDAEPLVSLFCGYVSVRFCAAEAVAVRDP